MNRMEVLRGPNSSVYRADAMAGVVSLTTRSGSTPLPEVTYIEDGGNFSIILLSPHEPLRIGAPQHVLQPHILERAFQCPAPNLTNESQPVEMRKFAL